jgi:hypothetical protein
MDLNYSFSSFRHAPLRRNSMDRTLRLVLSIVSIIWLVACGTNSSGSTLTTPTATATLATDTFTGSIDQNGTAVYPFTVTSAGYSLLAGYTSITPASVAALGLGIGSWDASTSTCSLNVSQNDTGRSGSTAVSGTPNNGNYCLRIYDAGNIPAGVTASYTVQVQHY